MVTTYVRYFIFLLCFSGVFNVFGQSQIKIAKLKYNGGGDWYANKTALPNLIKFCNQELGMNIHPEEDIVDASSSDIFLYPYVYMTGHGNVRFTDPQVRTLRRYLEGGGFLHADDNYGMDESFRREIARVFPDRPLVEVPLDHPIYQMPYAFPQGIPKIHEHDGLPAQGFGVFVGNRLVVYYSYQSDLGDGWEDADVHNDPAPTREQALRMGVNLFVYAAAAVP